MDNLLELIVPLVLAAIYIFRNILSEKSDEDDPQIPSQRRSNPEDAEAAERERTIQEGIRRKMVERGQGAGNPEPVRQMSAYEEQQRERRQAAHAQREQREAVKNDTPPPLSIPTDPSPMAGKKEGFDWDASDDVYESKIEQQLKLIEATKRKAEQLKKQAGGIGTKSQSVKRPVGSRTFSGPIRSRLRDPRAARAAFIYGEILGPPVSSGKRSNVPGLS